MRPWEALGLDWPTERVMEKLAERFIRPYHVEDIFLNGAVYMRNQQGKTGDWKMIGMTSQGKILTIVVMTVESTQLLRPITGWPATDRDIEYFWTKRR